MEMREKLINALKTGESVNIEFKSCTNKISLSVYDTICSFSNRSGGLIILGVDDDMNLVGINRNQILDLKKNIINSLCNKELFLPTLRIEPEIVEFQEKFFIIIDVPVSQYPVRFKNHYFDRNGDADQDITDNMELVLALFERKNPHLFEDRIVNGLNIEDLDIETFDYCRNVVRSINPLHPWVNMNEIEILESCKLINIDKEGNVSGYKYAALLLFGTEDAILRYLPRYKFELLYHKISFEQYNLNLPEDITRYSDRRTLRCNIIMSYIKMLEFLMKYLPDKFYLPSDGTTSRIDLRVQIFREVIGNICAHSDYQPGFGGYLEIFYDRVITRNATRLIPTIREGLLTLDELGPYTKNPLIVRVLNELHFVEDLGSGRRNIKMYAPLYYSESKIEITNGTQFEFSITYDNVSNNIKTGKVAGKVAGKVTGKVARKSSNDTEKNIIKLMVVIGLETLSVEEMMEKLNLKGGDNFRKTYLYPALKEGYIIMTEKDKPRSPKQKYYLSKKGKTLL
jgi:ATP-dependent DNA helicase RecG